MAFWAWAAKAGKVQSGEFSTEKSVKSGRAYLVIVSEEAVGKYKEEVPEYVYLL